MHSCYYASIINTALLLQSYIYSLFKCFISGAVSDQSTVSIPQTVEVMRGSCLTMPCSFNLRSDLTTHLNKECEAIWTRTDNTVTSSFPTQTTEVTGILTNKDCTTIFNNMSTFYSGHYYFRLDCKKILKETFRNLHVHISVKGKFLSNHKQFMYK